VIQRPPGWHADWDSAGAAAAPGGAPFAEPEEVAHAVLYLASDESRSMTGALLDYVDYFLRKERQAMRALMTDLTRGAFTYAPSTLATLELAAINSLFVF